MAKPTFVTGARKEVDDVREVLRYVHPKYLTLFRPKVDGVHGSKTLWESVKGHNTYWKPLEQFLSKIYG